MTTKVETRTPPGLTRWWIYQRERFPVFAHGMLILAFSSSAVCFSSLLGGRRVFPDWGPFVAAFATAFIFFLQLRIADEFKDIEEDTAFRPYRAVPRGLVTLNELGVVFVLGILIQLSVALWLHPPLVIVLLVAWIYLALMSREFFAREWLKARPVTYLWTHMMIMPLVDLYATATEWMPGGGSVSPGLIWFLAVSFFNGVVIEVGRKIRVPADEEEGVPTYTKLWGTKLAPLVWFGCVMATAGFAVRAGWLIGFGWQTVALLVVPFAIMFLLVMRFRSNQSTRLAHRFEIFSGVWTLLLYLSLGLIPMITAVFS